MADFHEFLDQNYLYAVVGISGDHKKYGYRVAKTLAGYGLRVVGINPKYTDIEGIPCYPSLTVAPEKPEVVVMVVPPDVTEKLMGEVAAVGVTKIWMQPGSENELAISFGESNQLLVVHHACIISDGLQKPFLA